MPPEYDTGTVSWSVNPISVRVAGYFAIGVQ